MNISHRGISLRQVAEDDMPFLFRLFADPRRCHLWMRSRRVYDEREFHQAWSSWTSDMMGAKFIVERRGEPIGLVFEYDRTLEDGHTKATVLLDDSSVGHGAGAIATALLVVWLFEALPVRKVFMDVYAYNTGVVRGLRKAGFSEEGVLKEVRYWNGVYWDAHLFAVHRESWPAIRDRVLRQPRTAAARVASSPAPAANGASRPALRNRRVQVGISVP